eukprot:9741-Chlamydomonas_euryale.AAC.4
MCGRWRACRVSGGAHDRPRRLRAALVPSPQSPRLPVNAAAKAGSTNNHWRMSDQVAVIHELSECVYVCMRACVRVFGCSCMCAYVHVRCHGQALAVADMADVALVCDRQPGCAVGPVPGLMSGDLRGDGDLVAEGLEVTAFREASVTGRNSVCVGGQVMGKALPSF